jgi:hypothetical protein
MTSNAKWNFQQTNPLSEDSLGKHPLMVYIAKEMIPVRTSLNPSWSASMVRVHTENGKLNKAKGVVKH